MGRGRRAEEAGRERERRVEERKTMESSVPRREMGEFHESW